MLAATAALFAACAETDLVNEVNVVAEPQAIGFETFAQKATRADEGTSNTALEFHHESFIVWASKQLGVEDNVSYTQVYSTEKPGTVTIIDGKWVASPLKFWDKAALNYYFYAAAPTVPTEKGWEYVNKTENDYSTGYLTLKDYTLVGTNLTPEEDEEGELVGTWIKETSGDKDLMIAGMEDRSNATFNSNSAQKIDEVHFTFRHILSKLNIKVMGDLESTYGTITLNTLDVCNLICKGSFSEQNNPRWTLNSDVYTLKMRQSDLVLNDEFVYTHEYLVMPQTVAHLDTKNVGVQPASGVYLHIKYTITTGTGAAASSEVFETYYGLADIFGNTALALNEGSQNTLAITIAPDVIEFEVSTDANGWDNKEEDIVDSPKL